MSEFQPPCQNATPDFFNKSWNGKHHYKVISAATNVLPSLIGIICSAGLAGNILIVFTIISYRTEYIDICICNLAIADLVHIIGMAFLLHQWAHGGEWVFGRVGVRQPLCTIITSLDTCNQLTCSAIMTAMSLDRYLTLVQPFHLTDLRTRSKTFVNFCLWVASLILVFPIWVFQKFKDGLESCALDLTWYTLHLTITTFFFPLPFICYILILRYTWDMYQQNKKAESYNINIPRKRVMKLTKMVLALVIMFVVSAAPFHVIQLVNLQVSHPTLTIYMSYYISICLSYVSSNINPFLYIPISGNFQKCLWRCINMEVRMAEQDVKHIENIPKSGF
ncbi:LOW QUALITY PROTEIN: melanin-concentrating hormone receptor 2 [Mergus octosetaceus]